MRIGTAALLLTALVAAAAPSAAADPTLVDCVVDNNPVTTPEGDPMDIDHCANAHVTFCNELPTPIERALCLVQQ